MDTKYLVTLKTILETGSFQKAASKLNYTQSTVTFHIQQLEKEFSLKLFEKIGRNMELTESGKDILPFIDAILQNAEQITNYKKDISEITGTLRLVTTDAIFIYLMQPIIKAFMHTAPNARLMFNCLPSEEINEAIINGSADIGVDCDKGNFPNSLIHEPAHPFQACLIASPHIDLNERDFITPHQKKPFSILCNELKANYHVAIIKYLGQKDIELNPYMKLQSIEAVKRSVINGLGIAYVPEFTVREELKNGYLIQLKTELDGKSFPSLFVYHKNKWLSPQMKLALQILIEYSKNDF